MASKTQLDQPLLEKIANKWGKTKPYIRVKISQRAAKLSISSEAAQILLAREHGIGTAYAFRKLDPHMQDQVREILLLQVAEPSQSTDRKDVKARRTIDPFGAAIDFLIRDDELKSRCKDLLRSKKHLDRVFREATTVLENRIKTKGNITKTMKPEDLVNLVLNPDLSKAIVIISDEGSEQTGFHQLCKGITLTFRNKVHHNLDDEVTREDALRFCGFIDVLLGILERAKLRVKPKKSS